MAVQENQTTARMHQSVHFIVALALLGAALAAVPVITRIPLWGAALLLFVAVTGALWAWWAANPSSLSAVSFALAAVVTFVLSDILLGFPLVMLAVIVMQIQFGRRAGWWFGGGVWLVFGVGSLVLQPSGGVVGNILVLSIFLLLGVLVGHLVTELQRAHTAELRMARDASLQDLDRALAAERLQQARLLHDDLGQHLTLISMGLDLAQRQRHNRDGEAWAEVGRAARVTQEALTGMRRQVRALSLTGAMEHAVPDALDSLVTSFAGTGLEVVVEHTGATERTDPLAYRIIQEGLTNVVRHSGACSVTVTLDVSEEVRVRVADNGSGAATSPREGFGLAQLRARVEAVGGWLEVTSNRSGFMLSAQYPLPEGPR